MNKPQQRRPKSVKQPHWWRVSQISGARARYVSEVEAIDAQEAIATAMAKFEVLPAHRDRLIAHPSD